VLRQICLRRCWPLSFLQKLWTYFGHKYSAEILYQIKTFPEVYINFVFWSLPGPPDPPRNCTLTNQTHDSLQVDCQEGFGSGLSQEFHMEVFTDLQVRIWFFPIAVCYQNLQCKLKYIQISFDDITYLNLPT
jgi:hypothetical protein